MKKRWLLAVGIIGLAACVQGVQADSNNRLGVGANYWTVLDNIDAHDIDKNGFSGLVSYQRRLGALLAIEADLEVFPRDFQGINDTVLAPEAYLILGSTIYAAAGVGILYADGDFANDPFYALRAGLDLEILPQIFLDLNVNYRFAKTTDLSETAKDIDTDTLFLGAAVRFGF